MKMIKFQRNLKKKESKKLDKYINFINDIFQAESISLFLDENKLNWLPKRYEKLYFSLDKRKCLI